MVARVFFGNGGLGVDGINNSAVKFVVIVIISEIDFSFPWNAGHFFLLKKKNDYNFCFYKYALQVSALLTYARSWGCFMNLLQCTFHNSDAYQVFNFLSMDAFWQVKRVFWGQDLEVYYHMRLWYW